jgi:HAD superfamily hydrolase (TIGR01509 family)
MQGTSAGRFKVQSIVFDLFHTLVDPDVYRPDGFTRAHKIAELLQLEEVDDFVRWWREMEAQRHVNGSKKVVEYADDYLVKHVGRKCTPAELEQVSEIWGLMHDQALLRPRDDVISALGALRSRGVKLGLLSNIDEREAVNWRRSPLSSYFDVACLSCDTGYSKPSIEAYSLVLSKLRSAAEDAVYVGDGSHDELGGAKRAGFGRVVFMKGFLTRSKIREPEVIARRETLADATITNLNQLVALVDATKANGRPT